MSRKLLLVGAMCVALASLNAATEVVNGITWTYTVSGGKASVGGGYSSATAVPKTTVGAITIPSLLGGYPVTSVGRFAFYDCKGLTRVTMPDSVTSIGGSAFAECSGLTRVTIPDSVTSIDSWAFSGCSGLTSVTIPDSVTSIRDGTFEHCSGLTSVTMPDSVTSIGGSAFAECSGLTRVTIPDSVTSINSWAFSGCSGLTSVTIPDSVTSIRDGTFSRCSGLMNVAFQGNLPDGVERSELLKNKIAAHMKWPRAYSVNYIKAGYLKYFVGFTGEESMPAATVVSSAMRTNDPTVMDVAYNVISKKATVRVRALAFEDGERSFAKVVRPETFVNDTDGNPTAQNVGDNIAANVTNALSWKVSSDWATRLSKVKFEVLACDGALLPMETTIIPESDRYGKMQISWNRHTNDQIFDALMWLYADKVAGLTLENGALKAGGKTLANGTSLSDAAAAAEFVYRSMGFDGVLSGDLLNYVNEETRLGLEPYGIRQYAYKFIEE